MKAHVHKLIGSAPPAIDNVVEKTRKRAHKTVGNLGLFPILETRCKPDKAQPWQGRINVGFTVET